MSKRGSTHKEVVNEPGNFVRKISGPRLSGSEWLHTKYNMGSIQHPEIAFVINGIRWRNRAYHKTKT